MRDPHFVNNLFCVYRRVNTMRDFSIKGQLQDYCYLCEHNLFILKFLFLLCCLHRTAHCHSENDLIIKPKYQFSLTPPFNGFLVICLHSAHETSTRCIAPKAVFLCVVINLRLYNKSIIFANNCESPFKITMMSNLPLCIVQRAQSSMSLNCEERISQCLLPTAQCQCSQKPCQANLYIQFKPLRDNSKEKLKYTPMFCFVSAIAHKLLKFSQIPCSTNPSQSVIFIMCATGQSSYPFSLSFGEHLGKTQGETKKKQGGISELHPNISANMIVSTLGMNEVIL